MHMRMQVSVHMRTHGAGANQPENYTHSHKQPEQRIRLNGRLKRRRDCQQSATASRWMASLI